MSANAAGEKKGGHGRKSVGNIHGISTDCVTLTRFVLEEQRKYPSGPSSPLFLRTFPSFNLHFVCFSHGRLNPALECNHRGGEIYLVECAEGGFGPAVS